MPVGRTSPISSSSGHFTYPGATASGDIRKGAAVAMVNVGGSVKILECGAQSYGDRFIGFSAGNYSSGVSSIGVTTFRGASVSPILENGVSLTPGNTVLLSNTLGEVTQTAPSSGTVVQLGIADTSSSMFINSDQKVIIKTEYPSAPIITSVTTGAYEISVDFLVESDGGYPLTDQEYSLDGGNTWVSIGTATTSIQLGPYSVMQFTVAGSVMAAVPQAVLDADIRQVAAGNNFALALDADGRVYAWGDNSSGQTTVPAGALSGVTKVTAGHSFAYVLKDDGSVLGWGDSTNNRFDYTGLTNIVDLVSGWFETLFIDDTGAVHRRGSSTGVTFNVSGWSSGVTSVGASRYDLIANQNGAAVVTGLANHQALNVPTGATSDVVTVQSDGGSTLWAIKDDGTIIGWGKADSGQMSGMHNFIQSGALAGVSSTYVAGSGNSAVFTISDPDGMISGLVPTQNYLSAILTSDGALHAFGIGGLSTMTFPSEADSGVLQAAFGGDFCTGLKAVLDNGVEYNIQIRAVNEKGDGPATTVRATPNP